MLPPQNQIQVENWRVDTHVITHVGHAQHLSINHRAAPAHVYPTAAKLSIKIGQCDPERTSRDSHNQARGQEIREREIVNERRKLEIPFSIESKQRS